jgi:hypothetical protein
LVCDRSIIVATLIEEQCNFSASIGGIFPKIHVTPCTFTTTM